MRPGAGFAAALGLLTRLPISASAPLSHGVAWFPVVGALVGLAAAGIYALGHGVFPDVLAATVAVAGTLLITGALHEDGLADYADAVGSRADPGRALEILRDPRVGVFGSLALIVSVAWRIGALSGLGPVEATAALVMANSLARSGAAALIGIVPSARPEGLGHVSSDARGSHRLAAMAVGVVIGAVAGGLWVLPAALITAVVVLYFARSARRRLGGMTGDVLGACEQVIEISLLTLALVVVRLEAPIWAGFL